jgi:peptidoglycan/LPS O-acetylase OafA/YrhL
MGTGLCFAYIANKYPARIKFSYLYSLLLIALIFHIFFNGVGAKYDYLISLIGGTLCYLLYCQNTYKSEKLKNNYINNYIKIISKYSLPIYVFHDIVISTLKKLNYSTENYPPQLYLLWVVLLAITMERLQKVLTLIYYRMKINLRG